MSGLQGICSCTAVMIFKEGKVLLGLRKKETIDGEYAIPGGKNDKGEGFIQCAIRETKEECGLTVTNVQFISLIDIPARNVAYDRVAIAVFTADWQSGEPVDAIGEQIGQWGWYDLDKLPKPLFKPTEIAINCYKQGKIFFDEV